MPGEGAAQRRWRAGWVASVAGALQLVPGGGVDRTATSRAEAQEAPAQVRLLGADPHVAVFEDRYWMYPTEGGRGSTRGPGFYPYSSADGKLWTRHAAALEFKAVPWIDTTDQQPDYAWAPAIAEAGGKYYLYYSVGPEDAAKGVLSRIGVAVGDSPSGPFKDSGRPLLPHANEPHDFEAIDPMAFRDPATGQWYLYAGGSARRKLAVFELAPDMITIRRRVSVKTPREFTEAPFMHHRNGTYYLSYSGGQWREPTYSVHCVTATSPTGPWENHSVILKGDEKRKGPGHNSFVQDLRSGEWLIAYHRWENWRKSGDGFQLQGQRSIAIERAHYGKGGRIKPIKMTEEGAALLQLPRDRSVPTAAPGAR